MSKKNKFFLKVFSKKFQFANSPLFFNLFHFVRKISRKLFSKRTIVLVSDKKITSVNLGLIPQIAILALFVLMMDVFYKFTAIDNIIRNKNSQISALKKSNKKLEQEVNSINKKFEKIDEYLRSSEDLQKVNFLEPNIDNFNLNNAYRYNKKAFMKIANIKRNLFNFNLYVNDKIKRIEKNIAVTGLNFKYKTLKDEKNPNKLSSYMEANKFNHTLNKLIILENIEKNLPVGPPMHDYYISSSYGYRSDPINHKKVLHKGLDFVGGDNAKIYSPSDGKVVFAGNYSNYGNAIVIDHGYGITSRYAHLKEIKINKGEKINKGDFIAIQGSTGKSTGSHLHYEIRYKDVPLNPSKFIEAGNKIYHEPHIKDYVNI